MYWNEVVSLMPLALSVINYNMRCIETIYQIVKGVYDYDKLQHEMYWNVAQFGANNKVILINYNMRCIETGEKKGLATSSPW